MSNRLRQFWGFVSRYPKLMVGVALVALLIATSWALVLHFKPRMPESFTILAGAKGGDYYRFAQQYQEILAKQGVRLNIVASSGALENLAQLQDPRSEAVAGFVQGGLGASYQKLSAHAPKAQGVEALATVAYEPVWIFTHINHIEYLRQLNHLKIAIGNEKSGTRKIALDLLQTAGLSPNLDAWLSMDSKEAVLQLQRRQIDALVVVGSEKSDTVWQMLHASQVYLVSPVRAPAIARLLPYLQTVAAPRGVFDLTNDIPVRDLTLLATTTNLVVKKDIHPALAYLLLDAADQVHRQGGALNKAGTFPQSTGTDFPLSPVAKRYFLSGKPFLEDYMPFWLADFLQRLVLFFVPLVAVAIPVIKLLPQLGQKWQEYKFYGFYTELQKIEGMLQKGDAPSQAIEKIRQLRVNLEATSFPDEFADRLYVLRQHIDYVVGGRGSD